MTDTSDQPGAPISLPEPGRRSWRRNGLRLFLVAALLLGVAFRLTNVERKFFWHDETYTLLRAAGYTGAEVVADLFDGHVADLAEIQRYQHPSANKGIMDVVQSLATEDTEHPPLYFALVHYWTLWFGTSPTVVRLLSVGFGLLSLPAFYLLTLEVFRNQRTALLATTLASVSPVLVWYSQEARQYSLWLLTIIISTWALVRALRRTRQGWWFVYFLTCTLGLYTHLFFALVLLAHTTYVLLAPGHSRRLMASYLVAMITALAAFSPWIVAVVIRLKFILSSNQWAESRVGADYLVPQWLQAFGSAFVNVDLGGRLRQYLLPVPWLIMGGVALIWLCRRTPRPTSLLVLSLTVIPALALGGPDILTGGIRSATARFLMPTFVGLILAIAFLAISWLDSIGALHPMGQALILVFIAGGLVSLALSARAETSWTRTVSPQLPSIARTLNADPEPLLIIPCPWPNNLGDTFALSYLLQPKVSLILVDEGQMPTIPPGFESVYLFDPSWYFPAQYEQILGWKLTEVMPEGLWRVER